MNRIKSPIIAAIVLTFSCPGSSLAAQGGIRMKASFSGVTQGAAPCEVIFASKDYEIDFHILNQPRGAVIHFHDDPGKESFFARSNLVARRGYDDLYLEESMRHDDMPGVEFKIQAEGIYSLDLVLLDFTVEAVEHSAETRKQLCSTNARFFASR